jgi:hypothetical protein
METQAKLSRVGCAEAFMAWRGNKVLCDKLARVRRFKTEAAAFKAGKKANSEDFR